MRHISAERPGVKFAQADSMPFHDSEIGAAASDLISQCAASIRYYRMELRWLEDAIKCHNLWELDKKLLDY